MGNKKILASLMAALNMVSPLVAGAVRKPKSAPKVSKSRSPKSVSKKSKIKINKNPKVKRPNSISNAKIGAGLGAIGLGVVSYLGLDYWKKLWLFKENEKSQQQSQPSQSLQEEGEGQKESETQKTAESDEEKARKQEEENKKQEKIQKAKEILGKAENEKEHLNLVCSILGEGFGFEVPGDYDGFSFKLNGNSFFICVTNGRNSYSRGLIYVIKHTKGFEYSVGTCKFTQSGSLSIDSDIYDPAAVKEYKEFIGKFDSGYLCKIVDSLSGKYKDKQGKFGEYLKEIKVKSVEDFEKTKEEMAQYLYYIKKEPGKKYYRDGKLEREMKLLKPGILKDFFKDIFVCSLKKADIYIEGESIFEDLVNKLVDICVGKINNKKWNLEIGGVDNDGEFGLIFK